MSPVNPLWKIRKKVHYTCIIFTWKCWKTLSVPMPKWMGQQCGLNCRNKPDGPADRIIWNFEWKI